MLPVCQFYHFGHIFERREDSHFGHVFERRVEWTNGVRKVPRCDTSIIGEESAERVLFHSALPESERFNMVVSLSACSHIHRAQCMYRDGKKGGP